MYMMYIIAVLHYYYCLSSALWIKLHVLVTLCKKYCYVHNDCKIVVIKILFLLSYISIQLHEWIAVFSAFVDSFLSFAGLL